MSQDERITGRPAVPRVQEFDEDAPPRPLMRVAVDLSGNYRDEPVVWLTYGAGEWARLFWPFVGFVLFTALFGCGCGPMFLLFLRAPLACGAFLAGLHVIRDGRVSDPAGNEGFESAGRLFISSVLHLALIAFALTFFVACLIVTFKFGLPRAVGEPLLSCGIWSAGLLLAAGTGYIFLRFSFANSLIADQQMSVFPAFAASWRMTRGHELALAVFYFILGLLFVAGLLAFGVGLFVTVPLISLAEASLYLHATGQANNLTPRPPLPSRDAE